MGIELLPTLTDAQVLGLTLWGEARSEPIEGRVAVACVIRNRLRRGRWGNSYRVVCLARDQFSCWNDGIDANHQALMVEALRVAGGVETLLPITRECLWVAQGIVSGDVQDNTERADHYLTRELYIRNPPVWARTMKVAVRIGGHVFLREGA
jgi:N-acetylmuramoyl-L-alanine amidase